MKVGFEVETIIPLFMDVVDQDNTENERLKVPSFEKFGEVAEWHLLVSLIGLIDWSFIKWEELRSCYVVSGVLKND